jgi:hypothetical protein
MLSRPPAEPANTVGRMQQRHARSVWRALAERSNDVRDLTLMAQTVILQLIDLCTAPRTQPRTQPRTVVVGR